MLVAHRRVLGCGKHQSTAPWHTDRSRVAEICTHSPRPAVSRRFAPTRQDQPYASHWRKSLDTCSTVRFRSTCFVRDTRATRVVRPRHRSLLLGLPVASQEIFFVHPDICDRDAQQSPDRSRQHSLLRGEGEHNF